MLNNHETHGLGRFSSDGNEYPRLLMMAGIWGVSNEQRLTIEFHEREVVPPAGFVPQPIRNFPTPGQLIEEIPDGTKKKMLERLYLEYQDLCAYAHGRPIAGFGKAVFDEKSAARREFVSMYGEEYVHDLFRQRVLGPAQIYSLLAVAQATAELTTICPDDVELRSAAVRAWTELHNSHLLVNGIWNIHTKALLGETG